MKNKLCVPLIALLLSNCAGKTPSPIQTHRVTDANLTCASIQMEMDELDARVRELLPDTEKTGKNVGLGIAGAFFLVPWFFMDFSDAERVEINAYKTRYNHLTRLYNDKQCGARAVIPPIA